MIPVDDVQSVGDALIVFDKRLVQGVVYHNGGLHLEFSDNITIEVKPHEIYEAWNLSLDDGTKMVSLPGGDLAVWEAE